MIRIAVVEDDPGYQNRLQGYIADFERECGESFRITVSSDGLEVAENYTADYDIILMDIDEEAPGWYSFLSQTVLITKKHNSRWRR